MFGLSAFVKNERDPMADNGEAESLKQTPLHDLHVELGGKMVPFAGYAMPVQFPSGIVTEHTATRTKAGLFDVSHMGPAWLRGSSHAAVSAALETRVPGEIAGLEPGRMRYTQFTNDDGGILDDLMVTRPADPALDGSLFMVVNASRKEDDFALLRANLPDEIELEEINGHGLLALQGPSAEAVLSKLAPEVAQMPFMSALAVSLNGADCLVSRSGYTGEDGYEILVPGDAADALARTLLAHDDVTACGLGARDSLRLEAGLCLYGHDIDETTSPVEAGLLWSISKRRREEGGFPGAKRIQGEIANGVSRRRVGIRPDGRAPARDGTMVSDADGNEIGTITSGGFGPTIGGPVAMGYVEASQAKPETPVQLNVRGKLLPAKIEKLPFVPANFKR